MDKRKRSDEHQDTPSKKRHMTTTTNKEPNETSTSAAVNVNDIEDRERRTFDVRTLAWKEDIDFSNTDSSCVYPKSVSSSNSENILTSMLSETNGPFNVLMVIKGNTEDRHMWKKNLFSGDVLTPDSLYSGTRSSRCLSSSASSSSSTCMTNNNDLLWFTDLDKRTRITTVERHLKITDLDKRTRITTAERRLKLKRFVRY